MCFSASASFTASWFLTMTGIVALTKIKKPAQTMFAAIPLLFALQQGIEGLLWLSFSYNNLASLQPFFIYGFLFFAFILWPTWIPLSLWIQESTASRKKILTFFVIIGLITSLSLLAFLVYAGAQASIAQYHILYQTKISSIVYYFGTFFYISTTVFPFFSSSIRYAPFLGCALLISYLVSYYWYFCVLVSVWCFFAALLSAAILIII